MHFNITVMMFYGHIISLLLCLLVTATGALEARPQTKPRKTCIVPAGGSDSIDDGPSILRAFHQCNHGGRIIFENTTYHINQVMNTSGLADVNIDLYGTLLWGTNITYWLNHSIPVGYQNMSTAWVLGGDDINFNGHGHGTFDGNGQTWYDYTHGVSNLQGRPHALTVANTTNSVFHGIRFVQSQMWTMSIIHTHHSLFDSIYVNSTTTNSNSAHNTDGADTIYSSHITFNNWVVDNGDDSISVKANSTDIVIANSTFHRGLGIAVGSIGQYKDVFETIQRVRAENITYKKTLHALYFKTWTGEQVNYPPNGGGGGLGYATDFHCSGLKAENLRGPAFSISQCTSFSGSSGNCTSSKFEISNITVQDISGTSSKDVVASFQCSAVKPCKNIDLSGVDLKLASNGTLADEYLCGNVVNPIGFTCTGKACEGASATGGC